MPLTGIQFSLLAILFFATSYHAQAACAFSPTSTTAKEFTVPLDSRTFSVPPGLPVGTTIASQYVLLTTGDVNRSIVCTTGPMLHFRQFGVGSLLLATGFTDVYQTNIEGIGVRFKSNYSINDTIPFSYQYSTSNSRTVFTSDAQVVTVSFVKTAETVAAGTLNASSLPVVEHAFGHTSSIVVYARIKMSGQFNITVPTCDISPASASMTVQMGSHKRSNFSGIGSGTGWKDASIQLINCPQFYGHINTNSISSGTSSYNNKTLNQYTLTANYWSLTLSPRNGVVNSTNGIMKIDEGAESATGVGIQLSATANETGKINLSNAIKKTTVQDGSVTAITIPLYARYIQTESTITGGKANGRLEYTITYQ